MVPPLISFKTAPPPADLEEEQSGAKHKKPAKEIDDDRRKKSPIARRYRKREHPDADRGAGDQECSSKNVSKRMKNMHVFPFYKNDYN
jgi:hypothetical protein